MSRVLSFVAFAAAHVTSFTVPSADFMGENCVVPPLSCFGTAPVEKFQLTAVESDLSSISFNPATGTFFAINNGDAKAFEVTLKGALLNSWTLPVSDPEGITWLGGRHFAVTDENPSSILSVELPDGAQSAVLLETISTGIEPAAKENLGFEGVTFIPGTGFLAAQEMNTASIWNVANAGATPTDLYGDLKVHSSAIQVMGDIARSCQSTDEYFILSKYPKAVHRVERSTGNTLETYAGAVCGVKQPEGLNFYQDPVSGNMRMVVVGEPTELLIFEADPTCTDALDSTQGDLKTCPVEDFSQVASCEATFEDGGCNQRRCDKTLTTHIKICVKAEPGVTDCSPEECKAHCVSGGLLACTHYAYDTAEKECYIFEGCVNEQWDEDYIQYAVQDPTCERTLDDYALGCEQRRCDKTISNHVKICTDAEPGVTDCSLEECKSHCETHLGFQCTTYAYDVAEKECYIFEACVGEQFDEDYSTYVLVDPTCGRDVAQGGCPMRLCDDQQNEHKQVCSGTAADLSPCSLEACDATCTGARDELSFLCSHFSYDPVDQDCVLFSSCVAESFSDDFTTYVSHASLEPLPTMTPDCDKQQSEGGCPQRRCAKKSNQNVKICEAPFSPCTFAECEAKCSSHTDFSCTHYAFDPKAGDCYVFDGCNDESDEADYNLYLASEKAVPVIDAGECDGFWSPNHRKCKPFKMHGQHCNAVQRCGHSLMCVDRVCVPACNA